MFGTLAFTDNDPYHVTVYKGGYVPTSTIYTTQGDLLELEDILEAVVKVEFEVSFVQTIPVGVFYSYVGNGMKNVFFVYDRPGKDFIVQAKYMAKKAYYNVDCEFIYLTYKSAFIHEWNQLSQRDDIYNIHFFLHGSPGEINFFREAMTYSDIEMLEDISIAGKAYLLSCNGGTEYENSRVAYELSERLNGAWVRAVANGSVYYWAWYQPFARWPLTREADAYWADFYAFSNIRIEAVVSGKGTMPFTY
jgi:hypothetical protein